jgi:hypothetical protein
MSRSAATLSPFLLTEYEVGLRLWLDYQVGRRKVLWLAEHGTAKVNTMVQHRRPLKHTVEGGDKDL